MKQYNPMLNSWDIQFMNDCVHEVIAGWNNHIIAYIPLPEDKQKNYNRYMREYNGPILYTKKIILAERVEMVNNYDDNIPPEDIDYGRRDNSTLMFTIPEEIPIYDDNMNISGYEKWRPDMFMVFQVDDSNDRYYVRSIKDRIGQVLVTIMKYDGTTPNGVNIDDIIIVDSDNEVIE